MRKIIAVLLFFTLAINNSIVFANNNSKVNGKYIVINNQSTNPYNFQSSGTIKNNSTYDKKSKTIKKYGMDKVIELKDDNENLYNQKEKNGGDNMSNRSNRVEVPEAKAAMDRFKTEIASELGVNLKEGYNGDLTSKEAGSIGGEMVRRMIRKQEEQMR